MVRAGIGDNYGSLPTNEPFSSCVAVGFDVVQDKDGLHDRGRSSWAAAQLGQGPSRS